MAYKKVKNSRQGKGGGVPSRASLYHYASTYSKEAIDTLYKIMKTSRNENVKMGAAKALLNKSLPDLRSVELQGEGGGPIRVEIIQDYVSKPGVVTSTSDGSVKKSVKV